MPLISSLQLEAYAVIKNNKKVNLLREGNPELWKNIRQNINNICKHYYPIDIGQFASKTVIYSIDDHLNNIWIFIGIINKNRHELIKIYWESGNFKSDRQYVMLLPYVLEAKNEELAHQIIDSLSDNTWDYNLKDSIVIAMKYGLDSIVSKLLTIVSLNDNIINWALISRNEHYIEKYCGSINLDFCHNTFQQAIRSGSLKWTKYFYEKGTMDNVFTNPIWRAEVIADSIKYLPEITSNLLEIWHNRFCKHKLANEAIKMNNVNLFKQMISNGANDFDTMIYYIQNIDYDKNNLEIIQLVVPKLSDNVFNYHVKTAILYNWPVDYIEYLKIIKPIDPNNILFAAGRGGRYDLFVQACKNGATKFKYGLYWACNGYLKLPDLTVNEENLVSIINYILSNNLIENPNDILLMAARGNHLDLTKHAIDTLGATDLYQALLGASFEESKEVMWHLIIDREVTGDMGRVLKYYGNNINPGNEIYPYSIQALLGFPVVNPETEISMELINW